MLDCEVAWYGDAAFDLAFLVNHLMLKAQHLPQARGALLGAVAGVWAAYRAAAGDPITREVEPRVAVLLPMLMLARVDGKSPVEYLSDDAAKQQVRRFSQHLILRPRDTIAGVVDAWEKHLGQD